METNSVCLPEFVSGISQFFKYLRMVGEGGEDGVTVNPFLS